MTEEQAARIEMILRGIRIGVAILAAVTVAGLAIGVGAVVNPEAAVPILVIGIVAGLATALTISSDGSATSDHGLVTSVEDEEERERREAGVARLNNIIGWSILALCLLFLSLVGWAIISAE